MKLKKIIVFVLCFMMLAVSFTAVAFADGATAVTPDTDTNTKYGTIPDTYKSADTYPFVIFKYTNGTVTSVVGKKTLASVVDEAKNWNNTWNKIKDENGKNKGENDTENTYTSTILLRRNYTVVKYTDTNNKGDKYDNYAQMQNECVIDLNGYTLTDGGSGIFFQVTTKPSSSQGYIFDTTYTVKNGNIAINKESVFYGNMWNALYFKDGVATDVTAGGVLLEGYSMADKDFTWNFENITFQYVSGASKTSMLMTYVGPQAATARPPVVAAPYYFNYTNCTFDLTNAPAGNVTLFNAAPTQSQWLKITVNVNGCDIIAPETRLTKLTVGTVESTYGSSVTFNAAQNGDVLTLTLSEGETLPPPIASTYVNNNGKSLYWHHVSGNEYALTECIDAAENHVCTCGAILSDCEDANADNICDLCGAEKIGGVWLPIAGQKYYPFAVLDKNGNYSSLQTSWNAATTAAASAKGTIVLRRDYTNVSGDSLNLKACSGTFTVDLNGNTLTRGYDGAYLFDNWFDSATTADTVKVVFKNGTIVAEKYLICLSGNAALSKEKQADFEFNNVNFKLASNYDQKDGWLIVVHSQPYDQKITTNITFTDCKFDTTEMRSTLAIEDAPILNLAVNNSSGKDYVKANVTFNGGEIVANRFSSRALYKVHSDDVVTFNKGSNGSYMTLTMPSGTLPAVPASSDYYTVNGESVYFHAVTVAEEYTTYTLSSCVAESGTHDCTCGVTVESCYDNTNDHKCDVCSVVISECVDLDKNHVCDICGGESACIDENNDHVCDFCLEKTPCTDGNNDHNCDLCGTVVTTCEDTDNNHNCDICGKELSVCVDTNKDELCDICGYVMNNYGIKDIDPRYASVETYPFFVLKYQNGVYTFEKAATNFYGAQSGQSAMGYAIYSVLNVNNKYDLENGVYVPADGRTDIAKAVVVMRRDYDLKSGSSAEYHNNMAHMQGTTTLDLGGYTLREASGSTQSLLYITAKGWNNDADGVFTFPCTLNITNGRLEVLKYAAITIATSDSIESAAGCEGTNIANSAYNINLEDVTIGLVPGATTKTLVYANGGTSNSNPGVAKVNVNIKDCVFDLKTNANSGSITIVNNNDNKSNADVDCDVVIEGCNILASSMDNVTVYTTSTKNGSSFTVKKGEDGKYVTLTMPVGAKAPSSDQVVVVEGGVSASFVKNSSDGENNTYVLADTSVSTYVPKMSLTLDAELVVNVYIPVNGTQSFTFDGESSAEFAKLTENVVELDGVSYYLVKAKLPAKFAAKDIVLKVNVQFGETSATGSFTFSIVKYASKILENGEKAEKALVKDLLAYIKSAYTYFGSGSTDAIDALLGGYTSNFVTVAGTTNAAAGLKGATFVLEATPAIRFYLPIGVNSEDYSFKQGGTVLPILGTGTETIGNEEVTYIDVSLYAYRMIKEIDYYISGTKTGTYHINDYYGYVSGEDYTGANKEKLVDLVEKFYTYCKSAGSYRNSLLCNHSFENGVCTNCGENDDVGTMTINAPTSIYSNYAGKDISVTFSKDWYNKEVTWSTDNANVKVENGKIYAIGTSFDWKTPTKVTVTAKTADHTATITVDVLRYRTEKVDVETKVQYYETNIIKEENKGGIIFVGDSYVDGAQAIPSFWRDFYQDYAGRKAFLMGMSSSKIDELEIASERIVYPMEPSEIVVHIGHNDVHSDNPRPTEEIIARIQALLTEYHKNLPNAKIYVLSVDPKRDSASPSNNRHESSFVTVPAVNAAMQAFAEANDWVTYVDTTSIFYTKNTAGELTAINKNMYPAGAPGDSGDPSHPTLVAYDLIRIKIDEARGDAPTNVININNADKNYAIGAGGKTYNVNGDFVISGRLVITQFVKSNSHLQFCFNGVSGKRPYRFLLWDNNSDGKYGIGYEKVGDYTNENNSGKELYDATNGLVLNWTVIVKENKAYWYVGGKLQAVFDNPTINGVLSIDATGMDAVLYDIDFIQKSDDETAYNNYIAPYFAEDVVNIEMYGQNGDINANGKTFTDNSGNALTNNYIVRGKLNIVGFGKSNPHLQFRFNSEYRFLLWDSNRDGKFGAGYIENGESLKDTASGITLYNANGGLVLDWAVVVSEGKAYWYINGKLEKVFENPTLGNFNIGALQMDAYLYDIETFVKSDDAAAYNEALTEYFSYSFEINSNFDGSAPTLASTGPTYTQDVFGKTLSGSNFVISGSFTITKMNIGTNMHIQFLLCDGYRFLIWDNSPKNGKFGAGYQEAGTHVGESKVGEPYDGSSGTLTLDWAIVVKDGKAYWFINDVLVKTFTEPTEGAFSSINIGATRMEVSVYDVEIYAENGSASEYNRIISQYTFS